MHEDEKEDGADRCIKYSCNSGEVVCVYLSINDFQFLVFFNVGIRQYML